MDTGVVISKVGVAAKCPPYHVFSQQTFPQRLLRHHPGVAEVGDTASELWREAVFVPFAKAPEGPSKAKFSVEHI